MATQHDDATGERLRALILKLCAAAGAGRSISPDAVARAAGGDPSAGPAWKALLRAVRATATALQEQGAIRVLRKGKPVDIRTAKGVIRLALPDDQP